ncbi:hypothetical protein BGW42_002312 [Actinomortierella wolfii]|nr:hypothetical protein BGW42_002312 [Actinomortierella wolfii]
MDEESLSKGKNLNKPRVQFDGAAASPPSRRPQRPPTPRPIVPGKRSLESNEEDDDDGQTASPSARPPTQPRPRLRSPSPALDLEEPAPEDDETSKNSSQLGSIPCTQSNTPAAPPSTPTQPSSDDVQFTQPLSLETSCTNTTAPSATPAATSIALSQPSSADTSQIPQLSIVQRRAVSYSQVTPTSSSMLNTPEQDMLRRRALIARLMGSRSCGTEGRDMHHHRHALHPPNQFDGIDIEHARNARLQSTRGARTGATIESGDDSTGEPKESVSTSSVGEDLGLTSVWPWESHGHQKAKDDQDKGQVDNTCDGDHIVNVHHDSPLKPDDEPLLLRVNRLKSRLEPAQREVTLKETRKRGKL